MRIGYNPNRKAKAQQYSGAVISAITHLPNMDGYHADRFEVIKMCLETMRQNTGMDDCMVLIWDNGSCREFTDWLYKAYRPDQLVLSPNVGKASARAGIIRMLPTNTIVGVSDDDMYFYPGWLRHSIEIFERFPNVGQVSAYPVRTQFRWGNSNTLAWASKNAKLETGRFIPEQWDRDFCTSIGREYDFHIPYTASDLDYRIRYKGVDAYAVAHHCQFMGRTDRLAPFAIWDDECMGDEKPFDNAIDRAGLLRLTTTHRLARHIGNVLDEDMTLDVKEKQYA